jgi:hypothetical protein
VAILSRAMPRIGNISNKCPSNQASNQKPAVNVAGLGYFI